jgi:hypothetical protein
VLLPRNAPGKTRKDEWVSKVEWHRVAIFRVRLAEADLNNIKKGAFSFWQVKILSQKELSGNGRVYLIVASSVDPAGNRAVACTTAVVPHDQTGVSL